MVVLIQSLCYFIFNAVMMQSFALPHPMIDDLKILWDAYPGFLKTLLHLKFGNSSNGIPVVDLLKETLPNSLKLIFISLFFYIFMGLLLGYIGAVRQGKLVDKIITVFTLITGSIPSFLSMFWLILLFSYVFHIFPPQWTMGYSPLSPYLAIVMPVIALSLLPILEISRAFRGELIEIMNSDYLLLAKIKGFKTHTALIRHGFKNVIISIFPVITTVFVYSVTTSFFVEDIYGVNGIARLFYDSLVRIYFDFGHYYFIDMNVAQATTLIYVLLGLSVNLLFDILTLVLDPRTTTSRKVKNTI